MDEAELLCDRIGIISTGNLKCLGSSLHLKNKFSKGYKVNLNFLKGKEEETLKCFQQLFPLSVLTAKYKHTLEFSIKVPNGEVSKVFETLLSTQLQQNVLIFFHFLFNKK